MRYAIITKKTIFICFCLLLTIVLIIAVMSNSTKLVSSSSVDKIIPIYCVDTQEKK